MFPMLATYVAYRIYFDYLLQARDEIHAPAAWEGTTSDTCLTESYVNPTADMALSRVEHQVT
jgi:hypothetical protein